MQSYCKSFQDPALYLLDKSPSYVVRIAVSIAFVPSLINLDWSVCEVAENEVEALFWIALKLTFIFPRCWNESTYMGLLVLPLVFPFPRKRLPQQFCTLDPRVWIGIRRRSGP